METFRFLLFGLAGVSLICWVAIMALWTSYILPKFFNEDKGLNSESVQDSIATVEPILGNLVTSNSFKSREKYSMRNFVIADFSPIKNNFKLNKLYTTIMIGVSLGTFIFLTYGLSSSLTNFN
tara:strand:- start:8 stop:376 length:369 start_codon:yes stop_codon:yes gene_type:complete